MPRHGCAFRNPEEEVGFRKTTYDCDWRAVGLSAQRPVLEEPACEVSRAFGAEDHIEATPATAEAGKQHGDFLSRDGFAFPDVRHQGGTRPRTRFSRDILPRGSDFPVLRILTTVKREQLSVCAEDPR